MILKKWSYDLKKMSRDPKKITPCACSITAANEMDLQVKVHHNQRVEKLFFSTLSLHPLIKESLVCELRLRIPKLNRMTTPTILEYLDDQGLGRPCAMRVWRIKLRNGPLKKYLPGL